MNRVSFIVDGFNLYHSMKDIESDLKYKVKWLNLSSLFSSLLSSYIPACKKGEHNVLQNIYYFTAYANQRIGPEKTEWKKSNKTGEMGDNAVERHKKYIKCLRLAEAKIQIGRFKRKNITCRCCGTTTTRHEEKETDVALAVKLFELFHTDQCDTTVIVTGDTDLIPAVKTAKKLFTDRRVFFAFPYHRRHKDLIRLAPGSFKLTEEMYIKHQFPNPVILPDGSKIFKPTSW